jgi:uncharacterized membrane protein
MAISDFINKYFLEPYQADIGYNFINTLTYALLALGLLYVIFKILQKYKIKIDLKLFISILPFIFIGSTVRALVDNEILAYTYYTVSPGIYLIMTIIFLSVFTLSYYLSKKLKYSYKSITSIVGLALYGILIIVTFSRIDLTNALGFFMIATLFLATSAATYLVLKKLKCKWGTTKMATLAISAHLLDAASTFVIVDFFGGWEKHPLPRFFANLTGTAATQFPLKLLILLPAVYLINAELKDKNLKNFLLIAIASLGLAQGLRNLISLIL